MLKKNWRWRKIDNNEKAWDWWHQRILQSTRGGRPISWSFLVFVGFIFTDLEFVIRVSSPLRHLPFICGYRFTCIFVVVVNLWVTFKWNSNKAVQTEIWKMLYYGYMHGSHIMRSKVCTIFVTIYVGWSIYK